MSENISLVSFANDTKSKKANEFSSHKRCENDIEQNDQDTQNNFMLIAKDELLKYDIDGENYCMTPEFDTKKGKYNIKLEGNFTLTPKDSEQNTIKFKGGDIVSFASGEKNINDMTKFNPNKTNSNSLLTQIQQTINSLFILLN